MREDEEWKQTWEPSPWLCLLGRWVGEGAMHLKGRYQGPPRTVVPQGSFFYTYSLIPYSCPHMIKA